MSSDNEGLTPNPEVENEVDLLGVDDIGPLNWGMWLGVVENSTPATIVGRSWNIREM